MPTPSTTTPQLPSRGTCSRVPGSRVPARRVPARGTARRPAMSAGVGVVGALTLGVLSLGGLSACSGSDEPEPTPTPTEATSPLESLLEEYLGDWSSEQVNAQLVRMEELTAQCMAQQGFDYTPIDYTAMGLDLIGEGLDAEWGSAEFAEQYGYGLSASPLMGDADEAQDPNAEYVAAMSASEQEAYYTALYGEQYATLSIDPEAAAATSWEDLGCAGWAQHEMVTGGDDENDQFAALQEEMATMMAAADADPRLNQANADWAACMAGAGYPDLAAVGDAEAALSEELATLQQAAYAQSTDPVTGEVDLAAAESALDTLLAEFRPREIETAVDDARCRADVGYDAVRSEVDAEYQTQFLVEHSAELAQWLDTLNDLRED